MSLTKVQVTRLKQLASDLRSGKYKQGQSFLFQIQNNEKKYCCLGVACDRYRKNTKIKVDEFWETTPTHFFNLKAFNKENGELSNEIRDYYGFTRYSGFIVRLKISGRTLVELNDIENKDFNFIANCIDGFIMNNGEEGFAVNEITGELMRETK